MGWISAQLARAGFSVVFPWWLGYALSAGLALFAVWWIYSSGLEAGRAECAAAALKEQTRQLDINEAERLQADAAAVELLTQESKAYEDLQKLDDEAGAAAGANNECLDAGSVQRINRIR